MSIVTPSDEFLPYLRQLAVSEWMTSVLRETGTEPMATGTRPVYVRYKPATNCLMLHEVTREDGSLHWVYSKLYSKEREARPSDRFRVSAYLSHYHLALSSFPLDQQMPALRDLWESDSSSPLFRKLISSRRRPRFDASWGEWDTVRYKPERRCLLRGTYLDLNREESRQRGFFARIYADDQGARTARWHRHFKSLDENILRVPPCLAYRPKYRILLAKELQGIPFMQLRRMNQRDYFEGVEATARALAHWHLLPPPADLMAVVDYSETIRAAASALASVSNGDAETVAGLAVELLGKAPPPPRHPQLIHGDFYYDQILIHPGRKQVHMLDLDQLAVGDPLIDLANFCAHLAPLVLDGTLSRSEAQHTEDRLLESYQLADGKTLSGGKYRWFKTAALLRVAISPFRRFRPDWPGESRRILQEAMACWGGSSC